MSLMNEKMTEEALSMEHHFNRIHSSIEQMIPTYVQSLSNLQQEYLAVWKNMMCSSIAMQEQYTEKMGIKDSIQDKSGMVDSLLGEIERGFRVHSYMVQTWLDIAKNSMQGFNENYTVFAQGNKKFVDSMTDLWSMKK